jgi:tRNA G10  N-methylase Trm11
MVRHRQLLMLDKEVGEKLKDWDFVGVDTQYATHGLHTYLAAMIPQIAKRLLAIYANKNSRVLDPFVGGGAVTTEAYLADISATGVDINNLALIISRAKSTPISEDILNLISKNIQEAYNSSKPDILTFTDRSQVDYWFKDYMFEPLSRLRHAIYLLVEQVNDHQKNDILQFLQCVYSNTVRGVSLTYRNEIRLRRLQKDDFDNFNPHVYEEFIKRLIDSMDRVRKLPLNTRAIDILEGDARLLPFADNSHDLVITSPPYGDIRNTIPYLQFSKNMLYWLGFEDEDIDKIRRNSLGSRNDCKDLPYSKTLREAVGAMTKESAIHDAKCFYDDYYQALKEITRVTSQRIIIVIGHRVLNNVLIDNAAITSELLNHLGWSLETRYERNIPGKRLHKKMAFGNNAQGATIDKESILVYIPQY